MLNINEMQILIVITYKTNYLSDMSKERQHLIRVNSVYISICTSRYINWISVDRCLTNIVICKAYKDIKRRLMQPKL